MSISEAGANISGIQNFGRLAASNFAPWGTFRQLGDTLAGDGSSRNDTRGFGIRFIYILTRFREPLRGFLGTEGFLFVFFGLVSRSRFFAPILKSKD